MDPAGPQPDPARDRFTKDEAQAALARYDLGDTRSIRDFPRGNPRSPKAVIETDRGRYLLKRRPPGSDPARVALGQHVHLRAHQRGVPTPAIIASREGDTLLRLPLDNATAIYELTAFIEGGPYPATVPAARDAGRTLGLLHGALDGFTSPWANHEPGEQPIDPFAEPDAEPDLDRATDRFPEHAGAMVRLRELWRACGTALAQRGLSSRPRQFIHADWHPGNTLWTPGGTLAAVIDFDEARLAPAVADLAAGGLHFALERTTAQDPDAWPDRPDMARLATFWAGYREGVAQARARADDRGLPTLPATAGDEPDAALAPWLMVRALVRELARAVAATGRFGAIDAGGMTRFVSRLAEHLMEAAPALVEHLAPRGAPREAPRDQPAPTETRG